MGDRRELDFDVEDGVRGEGVGRPALLTEGGDGGSSCLEQGRCLHFDVVSCPIDVFYGDPAGSQRGHGRG